MKMFERFWILLQTSHVISIGLKFEFRREKENYIERDFIITNHMRILFTSLWLK